MRLAIVGAGATGGYLGARLHRAGFDPIVIARGAHLAAMRRDGIRVRDSDGEWTARVRCSDDLGAASEADLLFLTVKAHALGPLLPQLMPRLAPDASLVFAQNGIPWWYFLRHGGEYDGRCLESVDPGAAISRLVDAERVIGCVVWPATTVAAPGRVHHIEGDRLTLGEPGGGSGERCAALAGILTRSSFKSSVSRRLRSEIWLKLAGNAVLNPMAALGRVTLRTLAFDPHTASVALAAMREVMECAAAVGQKVALSPEQRLAGAASVGEHRPSMLQDLEAGRALELEPLVGAVIEIGRLTGVPTPRLELLYALCRMIDPGSAPA